MYPLVAPPATCASRQERRPGRSSAVPLSARRPCCRRTRAPRRPGWRGRRRRSRCGGCSARFRPSPRVLRLPRASRDPRRVARANRARGGSVDAGGPRRRLARRARRRVAGRSSRDDVSLRSVGSASLRNELAARVPVPAASPRARLRRPRVSSCGPGSRRAAAANEPAGRLRGVLREMCAAPTAPTPPTPPATPATPRRQRSTFSPRKTGSTTFAAGTRSPVVKVSLSVLD